MAFTVSPSVVIREVDASAAVPAIATPPGAVAGVFRWGPVNEAVLITSEDNLVQRFGKPSDDNYETFFTAADFLAYANALYVTRADNGAIKAANIQTRVEYDANTVPAGSEVGDLDRGNTVFGAFEAKYPGTLGNSLDVAWVKGANFEDALIPVGGIPVNEITDPDSNTATVVEQTIAFNTNIINFELADDSNLVAEMAKLADNDRIVIGNDTIGYQEIEVASVTRTSREADGDANTALSGPTIVAYDYAISLNGRYTLAETDLNALSITRKWKYANFFAKAADTNNYHIAVVDRTGDISGVAGEVLELYENVSTTAGAQLDDGRTNYYETVIENSSSWVAIANTAHFLAGTSEYEALSDGTDGRTESTATLADLGPAYDTFKNPNEVDVQFVLQGKGDDNGNLANYIYSNILDTRRDCVGYFSPSKEAVVDESKSATKLSNVIAYRDKIQSSSYWFMDSGYKYRYDKYNDKYRYTPLNGDMAGLASRVEVFESPAGYRKGVVKNVVKLAFNPDKAQRDQLYARDINPVMSQVGQGVLLFGDKTGQGFVSAFDRINVRRLFIAVEKAIATAANSFLFELNDEFTQAQFKNIVEPFLREIQGRRGIIDFRVISDETVNTPTVIDQNKFRANIFIKPARSINVIELTFVATRTGVEFDEIVGQLT